MEHMKNDTVNEIRIDQIAKLTPYISYQTEERLTIELCDTEGEYIKVECLVDGTMTIYGKLVFLGETLRKMQNIIVPWLNNMKVKLSRRNYKLLNLQLTNDVFSASSTFPGNEFYSSNGMWLFKKNNCLFVILFNNSIKTHPERFIYKTAVSLDNIKDLGDEVDFEDETEVFEPSRIDLFFQDPKEIENEFKCRIDESKEFGNAVAKFLYWYNL